MAIVVLAGLGAFYALAYYMNQSTPLPEGCEEIEAACSSCSSGTCSVKPKNIKESHA